MKSAGWQMVVVSITLSQLAAGARAPIDRIYERNVVSQIGLFAEDIVMDPPFILESKVVVKGTLATIQTMFEARNPSPKGYGPVFVVDNILNFQRRAKLHCSTYLTTDVRTFR